MSESKIAIEHNDDVFDEIFRTIAASVKTSPDLSEEKDSSKVPPQKQHPCIADATKFLEKKKQFKAITALQRGVNDQNLQAMFKLAEVYFDIPEKRPDALRLYLQACDFSHSGEAYNNAGLMFLQEGTTESKKPDYVSAMAYFQKAIQANFVDALVNYVVACIRLYESTNAAKVREVLTRVNDIMRAQFEALRHEAEDKIPYKGRFSKAAVAMFYENVAAFEARQRDYSASFTATLSAARMGSLWSQNILMFRNCTSFPPPNMNTMKDYHPQLMAGTLPLVDSRDVIQPQAEATTKSETASELSERLAFNSKKQRRTRK